MTHPWHDNHFISINACEMWEDKDRCLSLDKKTSLTYVHTLRLNKNKLLSQIKNKNKIKNVVSIILGDYIIGIAWWYCMVLKASFSFFLPPSLNFCFRWLTK